MAKISVGLLMFRFGREGLQVLLVHPGGPFWAKKDTGAWSVPKGEPHPGEDFLSAAVREFKEETGFTVAGNFIPLSPVTQAGGKVIHAWAFEGDCDPASIQSNTFSMEWPPRSGRTEKFPEVDKASWFDIEEAKRKINKRQAVLLTELRNKYSHNTGTAELP